MKKYNGTEWVDTTLRQYKTATDTFTTLPVDVYADGNNATVGLKGNTTQNGAPTPENPVMPEGCGDLETVGAKAGQYKIPISSANTTTNVYLGEMQTTRKVKKYEFTGQETFNKANSTLETGTAVFSIKYVAIGMDNIIDYDLPMSVISYPFFYSTHFKMKTNTSFEGLYTDIKNGEIGANSVNDTTYNRYIVFASNQYTTADDFKAYLAAQYAAGTPVTVWYVLATETTGIVNEPLMKIGGYADTVSGITVPTITGEDIFDVETTIKPSEVSLNYTGWHDTTVEEWDGSQWNE